MLTCRGTFRIACCSLLLCLTALAEQSNNNADGGDSNVIPCAGAQCYSGGECVNLDSMHPCQCPFGLGGLYCEKGCDYEFQEGQKCGEWRVNTPICREPFCEEQGIIVSKVYGENSDLVYTLLWGEPGETEVISVNLSNGDEGLVSLYAWSFVRSLHAICECQNGGACNYRINAASQNGGSSPNSIESVDIYCVCPEYALGEFCEDLADCDLECQNGGMCNFYRDGSQTCSCPVNFYGLLCDVECTLDCRNNGYCIASGMENDTIVQGCSCGFYFEGDLCETERTCTLDCENGGKCVLGNPMFDEEILEICQTEFGGDCPEELFSGSADYCDCPSGWTGTTCSEPCLCQNGGTCPRWRHNRKLEDGGNDERWDDGIAGEEQEEQDGNEGFYCSCPYGYHGSECQFKNFNGECNMACQNGGYCSMATNWSDDDANDDRMSTPTFQFCICQDGFVGEICEIKLDGCRLACQNGGICTNEAVSVAGHGRALDDWSGYDEYCGCTDGFFGELCERKECGSGYCENGAGCIVLPSGQTAPDGENYVCDCSVAFLNEIYSGGRHCESTTEDICYSLTTEANPNEPWYCTNNAKCILDESGSQSCFCLDGYEGPRCEFVADTGEWSNCGMLCENGGTCLKGVVKPVANMFSPFLETSNGLFDYAPTDDFEYCYCQTGSFGIQCENQYDLCAGGEHICFHGSTCLENGDQWDCDCSEVKAAGLYCQHEATEICDDQDATNNFCTNYGTCSSTADTICDCVEGWEGVNCEINSSVSITAGGTNDEWSGAVSLHGAFGAFLLLSNALLFMMF